MASPGHEGRPALLGSGRFQIMLVDPLKVSMADATTGTSARGHGGRQWLRVFLGGLLLWAASLVVMSWTGNANLVPTVILLGSFLVPVTFVVYAFERHADQVLTTQRIFIAFLYGGAVGVLGASVLEAEFLKRPSDSPTSASG